MRFENTFKIPQLFLRYSTLMRTFCPEFLWELNKLDVSLTLSSLNNEARPEQASCVTEMVYREGYFSFLWQKLIGKYIPNSLLMKLQVVFNNKRKLHLWENHIYTFSIQQWLTYVLQKQVTRRVLGWYSHSYVFFMNQIYRLQLQA
jgi:hypothetical protein